MECLAKHFRVDRQDPCAGAHAREGVTLVTLRTKGLPRSDKPRHNGLCPPHPMLSAATP
jgi:hypothetical protein